MKGEPGMLASVLERTLLQSCCRLDELMAAPQAAKVPCLDCTRQDQRWASAALHLAEWKASPRHNLEGTLDQCFKFRHPGKALSYHACRRGSVPAARSSWKPSCPAVVGPSDRCMVSGRAACPRLDGPAAAARCAGCGSVTAGDMPPPRRAAGVPLHQLRGELTRIDAFCNAGAAVHWCAAKRRDEAM